MDMKLILFLLMLLAIIPANAHAFVCGVYFTGSDCKDCKIIDNYIQNESNITSNLTLIKYDLTVGDNIDIANMFIEQYGLSDSYRFRGNEPFILFSESDYLSGIDEIKECFPLKISHMEDEGGNPCPFITIPDATGSSSLGGDIKNSGGGGEIPGEPEILEIKGDGNIIKQPKEPVLTDENMDSKINESKKIIGIKKRERVNKDIENKIYGYAPFIYAIVLIAVLGTSIWLYIKKSQQ